MDDVHVCQRLIGRKHVRCLRDGHADRRDGLRIQEVRRDWALRLAHREQPDLVPELLQTPGEVIDDDLGPAVGWWWYWHPGRGNQADSHLHCLLVSSRVTITLRQTWQQSARTWRWARAGVPRRHPEGLAWPSSRRHGHTAARGIDPVVPVVVTSSGSRTLRTRGEVPELIGDAPITVRSEPLTECNLPAGNVRQTSAGRDDDHWRGLAVVAFDASSAPDLRLRPSGGRVRGSSAGQAALLGLCDRSWAYSCRSCFLLSLAASREIGSSC